jgi:hypothetical protein
MKHCLKFMLTAVVWAGATGVAYAKPSLTKAQVVIAKAKQASGGVLWDAPQGCFEEGTRGGGAITYKTRFSLQTYGIRIDSERGGNERSMGFNGVTQWQSSGGNVVATQTEPHAIKEAFVTAYLSNNGFFFPSRFPAALKYLRRVRESNRSFDVVEVAPAGGYPFELWFDRRTHLIARVIDNSGPAPSQVVADDYREVQGLTIAFSLSVIGSDGQVMDRGRVTSFRCGAIDNTIFDPPTAR